MSGRSLLLVTTAIGGSPFVLAIATLVVACIIGLLHYAGYGRVYAPTVN